MWQSPVECDEGLAKKKSLAVAARLSAASGAVPVELWLAVGRAAAFVGPVGSLLGTEQAAVAAFQT